MSADPTPTPLPKAGRRNRALAVRPDAAAALLGVSRATWDRLDAAGKTPAPVCLGGAKLYGIAELRAWVAAGCPDRRTWSPIWAAHLAARRARR